MSKKDPADIVTIPFPDGDDFFYEYMDSNFDRARAAMCFIVAIKLRLFDHTTSPTDAVTLASALETDEVMTGLFCEALASEGLLRKDGDRYVNERISDLFFVSDSPLSQFNNIGQSVDRLMRWKDLENALINGPAVIPRDEMFGERWIDAIGEGAISGGIGTIMKDLESKVDLDSLDTFIDVGGGHALYSIALSYLHPNLKGTVFDKPHIIKVAERNISDYGSDVSTISGDYYTDDIPGTYDLVFASFNQMCSDPVLVPKIVSVMSPGGYMYIRRHRKAVSENALRNLEWNLAIWEGMPKGQKRHGGEFTQKSEEYIDAMESAGIRMISRETLDNSSEILVFRRCEDGTGSGPGN